MFVYTNINIFSFTYFHLFANHGLVYLSLVLILYIYIYLYICVCVFYRLTRNVMHCIMQLKKPSNIKNKPNQTKQVKITKTKNINVCTNKHINLLIH